MAGDLLDLAAFCNALPDRIRNAASEVARDVAFAIESDLTQVTPIDTGAAISNWQVSLNTPATSAIPPYVPSRLGQTSLAGMTRYRAMIALGLDPRNYVPIIGDGGALNASAAMDVATQVLSQKAPGEVIHIVNLLDYIQKLDEGSSKQAPAGFVDRALLLGGGIAKRARLNL